jgi:Xaa-Pro aminopeptidase
MKIDFTSYLKSCPYLLISSPANIEYLTAFFGFSHTERECFLLISRDKNYLITDGRYSEAVAKVAKDFEVIDTGATRFISQKSEITKNIKRIGIESYDIKVNEYRSLGKIVQKIVDIDLSQLRIIKQEGEIANVKEACRISDKAFEFILGKLKNGVTELEISDLIKTYYKKNGAEISFPPIVAFGPNSSVPHHVSGNTRLRQNSIVLLDFGGKAHGYCSDMTRTVFFGKADREFKKMHSAVLQAQKLAISKIKSGVSASNVDRAARNYLTKMGYGNIPHSVGHGIGLEVHEAPHISKNSKEKFKENMVFSVEPGAYLPGIGGVRIEDLVLIKNGKPQLISFSRRNIIEV